jgi:histidinol-phosphate aminotransferase
LEIAAYVGGESRIAGIADPIRLASNESALGASPRAIAAYGALAGKLHLYPDGHAGALRAALAAHYGIEAERIVCSNGSDELISLLAKAYAGPGDEVLFSQHGFAMYPIATHAAGATPVVAPERNLTADVDAFLARVTERTKLVFIANPNNPTGSYLTTEEMARLHAGLPADVLLVVDAAYAEFVSRNDYTSGLELVRLHDNVVMTRTFSKIYGLAALRLGWCYAPAGVADVLNRTRGPFNVSAAAQAAGIAALDDVAHTDRARTHNDEWLPWLTDELTALGLTVAPSVGNFVLVRFPGNGVRDAKSALAHLNARGIIPRAVAGYGLPDCLRFTIGKGPEMQAVVDALADFMAG